MSKRWSEEDLEAVRKAGARIRSAAGDFREATKPNKYRAKRTKIDGISFASQVEGEYYKHLKALQAAGEIGYFLHNVRFDVLGKRAEIDFAIFVFSSGAWNAPRYVDVKGSNAPDVMRNFRRNKKQIETAYPDVLIETVRWVRGQWEYST